MIHGSSLVIFNDNSEVLLVKRRDYPIWVIPGGGIEAHESPLHAALREAEEETGHTLKFSPPKKFAIYTLPSGKKSHFYISQHISGKFTKNFEASEGNFFSTKNLPETFAPFQKMFIDDAINFNGHIISRDIEPTPYSRLIYHYRHHPGIVIRFLIFRFFRKLGP